MLSLGTILQGRYRIIRIIGRGGMGAVYEAKDERLGHRVALKHTLVSQKILKDAFEREAQMLACLNHAALPRVTDYFKEDGGQFLVMSYIPGPDLAELLHRQERPFAVEDVLAWAKQLLDVLDYLHSHQPPIIHRDIKPANLKLSSRGTIMLLDFGLSKGGIVSQGGSNVKMRSLYGFSLDYAPWEQIEGTGTDQRSDLYSLGATLYHLLTSEEFPTAAKRLHDRISEMPDPLCPVNELNPNVNPALATVLTRAMALNPAQRFSSARSMQAALRQVPPRAPRAPRPPRAPRAPRPPRRRKGQAPTNMILISLLVLALLVMSGVVIRLSLINHKTPVTTSDHISHQSPVTSHQ